MKNIDLHKAVFTVKQIVAKAKPILSVIRDTDDEWQFLTGEDVSMADMVMVTLKNILDIDPSLTGLLLQVGYEASRATAADSWHVQKLS